MSQNWFESIFGSNVREISIEPISPLALLFLSLPLVLLHRRGKSLGYLICFSLFFLYLWAVASYTIFELPVSSQEIRTIQQFPWSESINLVPGFFPGGFAPASVQIYGNFLLGVPFGVGLPFVTKSTHKRVVAGALGFAIGIEVLQLLIGLGVYRGPYRTTDINDVWLVFAGAIVGYALLLAVAHGYRRMRWAGATRLPVVNHLDHVLLALVEAKTRTPDPTPTS